MGCSKCKAETCGGCGEQGVSIGEFCNPIPCDTPECDESHEAKCVFYTGLPLMCGPDEVVSTGDSMELAAEKIIDYFCEAIDTIALTPGPQGAAGTNGTNGVDGVDGATILRRTFPMVVSPVSLLPYSLDNTTLPDTNDSIEITLFVIVAGSTAGTIKINYEGDAIYTYSFTPELTGTLEISLLLSRTGLDMKGHGKAMVINGTLIGNFENITVPNWFSISPGSLTFDSTGDMDVTFGELTIKKLLTA